MNYDKPFNKAWLIVNCQHLTSYGIVVLKSYFYVEIDNSNIVVFLFFICDEIVHFRQNNKILWDLVS